MGSMSEPGSDDDVSIIRGGDARVSLALALLSRVVRTTVHERSESFR